MTREGRAVSSLVAYVVLIGVTLALTTGLVLGSESLVEDRREETARSQLEIVGERLADSVMTADRLVRGTDAEPESVELTQRFPARVAGSGYTVAVDTSGPRPLLRLASHDLDVTVTVPIRVETDLQETRINGGTLRVVYDPAATPGRLEVHHG